MTDTLYEIYTDTSDSFSVGTIVAENESDVVFRGIDEEGKISAYYAVPRTQIVQMQQNTDYLGMIRKFMQYGEEHPYSRWFRLPDLPLHPEKPLLTQILNLAKKRGEIVTVGVRDEEDYLCGYVEDVSKGKILLRCVDSLTGADLPQVLCRIRDLKFVEYGSVFNTLLQYANEHS